MEWDAIISAFGGKKTIEDNRKQCVNSIIIGL